ncbi:cystathionine beta-lyase [Micractinium conductrix]|uniref:cysteine-S-conjugate beta-lyase n=1 Tax=Micractinium conductrix TaxID=554055 RepID=A0A2P6VBV9_9CHLO|nr:cystathionine beta-lyase [Micractinium conductrix]|eukprot:PSC71575.1 cystathionine beta-lyase [Micractinium conductrix]
MPSAALLNTSGRSLAAAATSRRRHASSGTIQRPARMQPAAAFGADSAATNGSNGSNGAAPRRRLATLLLHSEGLVNDEFGASMPPIYQTATFTQPGATDMGEYDYSRSGNPTRTVLERQLAVLEGAERAFAFSSGMSALAAVTRLLKAGDHVVAGDDLYGGTSRLLSRVVPAAGIDVTNVDTSDVAAVAAAIRPGKTALVMLESPTNPRMQICDIKAICEVAHAAGALVCVDNSILTCLYQRPLDLGADIAMTSATKFIGGHSDVTAGVLAVKDKALADRIYFVQNAEGTALGPFDSWLLVRGIKTMALRMERQAANAMRIAQWLAAHPLVKCVNFPGLEGHAGKAVHDAQATSAGSVISFITDDAEVSRVVVEETQLFKITVSFGNVLSLISMPCFMSHASIPADVRAARGLPDDLVRISVGIEDIEDLIEDLEQAFQKAAAMAAARGGATATASPVAAGGMAA